MGRKEKGERGMGSDVIEQLTKFEYRPWIKYVYSIDVKCPLDKYAVFM